MKMYFVKNNSTDCKCERHRINIPTLGWVPLKEKGYIPTTKAGYTIRSGTISMKAGRYYISALVELPDGEMEDNFSEGIGIDLELKVFAAISNRTIYKNINKVKKVRDLEKQLRREQKCFFRKYENLKKGKSTQKNIRKQKLKVQKIFQRICNIRTDYINKIIAEIVKIKPSYITMKDLHVKGMMKNKYLMKSIISQKFYEFRNKIKVKCEENGIELRIVDEKYLASSICYCCGIVKNYLKPCDKIFLCECGYMEDKYLNTALNLKDATIYTLA